MLKVSRKQPLRIAYLSDSEIPSKRANTVHVMKMCSAFSSLDTDVTLFCNCKGFIDEDTLFNDFGVKKRFRIIPVKAHFRGKLQLFEFAVRKAFRVMKGDYDFLYGRSLVALTLLKCRKPFIYESHIIPNRKLFVILEKRLLKNKNCLQLVVISQSLKDGYLKLFPFLRDENITVLHDGADVFDGKFNEADAPERLVDAHKKGVTIGYIGHLYPGKCMEVMIKIAEIMTNHTFHVIGGTDEWVNYWKQESQNKQINNIVFYGFIDNSKVNACYQYIDIVLLPFSDNIYYNKDKKDDIGKYISPLKLFEAMACGKAVIASSLVSIEEVLENGKDALLIPASDVNSWYSAICKLINNANLREELGHQARIKLESNYSWRKRAEQILDIINYAN